MQKILFLLALLTPNMAMAHDVAGLAHHQEMIASIAGDEVQALNPLRVRALQVAGSLESQDDATFDAILNQFSSSTGATPEQNWLESALWPSGHVLRICFFDGSEQAQGHVLALLDDILQYTNLGAAVSVQPCPVSRIDVQIKFSTSYCMGYYGREGRSVFGKDPNQPSVSLCGFDGPFWSAQQDGVIRHELMHTLGAVHEHQHPDSKCREELDWEGLLAFAPTLFTSDQKIVWREANYGRITETYSSDDVRVLPVDKSSIMHYRLDAKYFTNPQTASCALLRRNNDLSAGDKKMLQEMYHN